MKLVPAPPRCSGCFLQKTEERHVDFEASYDGPVIEGAPRVVIDELILCEACLTLAARQIGLGDVAAVEQEVALVANELRDTQDVLAQANATVEALRRAVALLPAPEEPAPAPEPKPAPKPEAHRQRQQQARKRHG